MTISDFHYPTADLLEKRFQEGQVAAYEDKDKPEGYEAKCPYTNDYERRWWLRGYHSKERQITNLAALGRIARPPAFDPYNY